MYPYVVFLLPSAMSYLNISYDVTEECAMPMDLWMLYGIHMLRMPLG